MKACLFAFALLLGLCTAASPMSAQKSHAPAAPEAPIPAPAPEASSPEPGVKSGNPDSTYSLITDRIPITSLDGVWKFQPGDDPRWSDPNFDDSKWSLVQSSLDWKANNLGELSGLAWYRFRVTLPPGDDSYSIRFPEIRTCYQVFVDGTLLLTQGRMPPHAALYRTRPVVVDIPSGEARSEPQTVVVAIRVWQDPASNRYAAGGLAGTALVGEHSLIHSRFDSQQEALLWQYSDLLDMGVLELLAFVISLALFLSRRSEREYLWFGILVLSSALHHLLDAWKSLSVSRVVPTELLSNLFFAIFLAASLLFYRKFLDGPWTRKFQRALVYCGLWYLNILLLEFRVESATMANLLSIVFAVPVFLNIIRFVRRRAKEKIPDARRLRKPVALLFAALFYSQIIFTAQAAGVAFARHFALRIHKPFYLTLDDIAEGYFLLSMLVILLSRFGRTRREQERVASELEAARAVQKVLVPESLPQVPGLSIATAYHPAEEVGGDFFQIVPLRSGDTLVVIGDVAGKGLPAALTVSLVVGTLRAIVDYTASPGEILAGLNRRLYGRGTGFTTCLALKFSADRSVLTMSNAGHPPAYVNGYELRSEPNLPLGLDPDAEFGETRYGMSEGDHITVLTDGVPEAMHGKELFGFERTGMLSRETAPHIADAARTFGQSDDITVLTVDIVSVASGEAEEFQPALQPA